MKKSNIQFNKMCSILFVCILIMMPLIVSCGSSGGGANSSQHTSNNGNSNGNSGDRRSNGNGSSSDNNSTTDDDKSLPEFAGVPALECRTLLTTSEIEDAVAVWERQSGDKNTLSFNKGERCYTAIASDYSVFVQIEPGNPGDFETGTKLLGAQGTPVSDIGDDARWFLGTGSEGAPAGVLSVRQDTSLGVIYFRIAVGRPDLNTAELLDLVKGLALNALPRFPSDEDTLEEEPCEIDICSKFSHYYFEDSFESLHQDIRKIYDKMNDGSMCKEPLTCGDIVMIDCGHEVDGPLNYYDNTTGEVIMYCGGACMISDPKDPKACAICPPVEWTCDRL